MTQNEMILDYLRNKGSLTQAKAIEEFGCYRLPARICDLRRMGHTIPKTIQKAYNRFGKEVRFAEYRLVER